VPTTVLEAHTRLKYKHSFARLNIQQKFQSRAFFTMLGSSLSSCTHKPISDAR